MADNPIGFVLSTLFMPEGVTLQRRFDHYLKGIGNGWEQEPSVEAAVRIERSSTSSGRCRRHASRVFTSDAENATFTATPSTKRTRADYDGFGVGRTFTTGPLTRAPEFAGPIKLRLWIASSANDMDTLASIRAFDPKGVEQTFFAATEAESPVTQGWLRASHRKVDPARSTEEQSHHSHDELQLLIPGERYMVDVEIWPARMYLPAGYRLDLTIEGKDFERQEAQSVGRSRTPILSIATLIVTEASIHFFAGATALHTCFYHSSRSR
jgi:uncharacterized protein